MTELQKKMFAEIKDENIFQPSFQFGSEYLTKVFDRNIFPTEEAIKTLSHFEEKMPEYFTNTADIIQLLHQFGSPATVAQLGGRYFGFVCGSVVPVGMAAKLLGTFWDQNTGLYVLSPLASKLETVVENWLKEIFNLPESTVAGFVSGTSMATLCGFVAARYRLLKNQSWDVTEKGFQNAPPIKVIASAETHSTVIKDLRLIGIGKENILFIDTDEQGRIKTELIPQLDNTTLLILQAGNVNSGSFDNFSETCLKAKQAGAWVHIDGAFGLWAAAVKKLSYLTHGMQHANSWAVDGHKTLNTPYDCGIALCNDKEALTSALHMTGGYIPISNNRDGMYYTPEMSRRARVIELWAILKYLGKKGIDEMIFEMHLCAKQFAVELSAIKGFRVMNEIAFNQILVCCDSDELTNNVIENIQQERVCWVGGSTWKGKRVIRISVCSWATTEQDVKLSVRSFESSLHKALNEKIQGY